MYIVRIGAGKRVNCYAISKPCAECTKFLKKFFPGKVIYSTTEGFTCEKVTELTSNHLSYHQRALLSSSDDESD